MALTQIKTTGIADNAVTDAKVVDAITSSNHLPLAGGTMTGVLNMNSQNITNAGTIQGTLSTASQTNITSVGTLSSLTTSGKVGINGAIDSSFAGATIHGTSMIKTTPNDGSENRFKFHTGGAGDNPKFIVYNNDGSTEDFKVDNGTITSVSGATFGGDLTIPEKIIHSGDTDTFIRFTDGSINFSADNTTPLVLDATSGTGASIQGHLSIGSGHTPSSDFGFNTHITHIKKDGDVSFIIDNATEKFEFCMNDNANHLRICAGARADILNLEADTGNVGINMNAPAIASGRGLHIKAPEANLHAGLRLDTPSGADWSIIAVDNDDRLLVYDNKNSQYGLTIDGQNIGIGTTAVTSDAMLHIKKDQSAYTRFLVENNTNSTSTQALGSFKSNAGTFFMGISSTAHSAGGDVVFNQTATNKGMRWFTNGSLSMRMFDDGDLQLETGTYYVNTPGSSGNAKAGYLFKNSNNIGVAQVRSSGGRGLVLGRQDLSANAFTTIADSHWGGTALVAWAGSGVQGMDMVAYGYNSPVTVLYSSQWAGSQTRTYVGSTYQLQLRLSTAANVWVLFLGT